MKLFLEVTRDFFLYIVFKIFPASYQTLCCRITLSFLNIWPISKNFNYLNVKKLHQKTTIYHLKQWSTWTSWDRKAKHLPINLRKPLRLAIFSMQFVDMDSFLWGDQMFTVIRIGVNVLFAYDSDSLKVVANQ